MIKTELDWIAERSSTIYNDLSHCIDDIKHIVHNEPYGNFVRVLMNVRTLSQELTQYNDRQNEEIK